MARTLAAAAGLALALGCSSGDPASRPDATPSARSALPVVAAPAERLEVPEVAEAGPLRALRSAAGSRQVIVRLATPPTAALDAEPTEAYKADPAGARRSRKAAVDREQRGLIARHLAAPGARVLGRVQHVLNAVFVEADDATLAALERDPSVLRVAPVGRYELDLPETVPYVGASAVHAAGHDGAGARVAVLDSGIDYNHAALGGSGDPAAFAANDPAVIEPGSFPTAKVVGGYDFVGGAWTGAAGGPPLAPDADPLDAGAGRGHGTHVADIIGGALGVAPGASLYAVKVCSSVSTSCSGVALIQGMEFAVDPDGDGSTADRVDVINMSLGSNYGQPFDDDLSLAVDNASRIGVLTVASAGNGGDKPFVTGSPAAATSALSVAQTAVPSAFQPYLQVISPGAIAGSYRAAFQPWSPPPTARIEAPVQYGDGAGGNRNGCAPFAAGSLAGKIVLVDRGACTFTLKAKNVGDGGALAAVIGLIAPGDPFEGGDGGDRPITVPGYMISQADSNRIKGQLAAGVVAAVAPDLGLALVRTVVGSSSRGPQFEDFRVKPEIGAPGASVSAIAGSGAGVGPFGGTSGAAPMVSGAAALLVQARGRRAPQELKALLMNNAETAILNAGGGLPAPVSRIGAGELRVDRALTAPVAAFEGAGWSSALSFGWLDVTQRWTRVTRKVIVKNYTQKTVEYAVRAEFRFAEDEASGAVRVQAPASVSIGPRGVAFFEVALDIDADLLAGNFNHSGSGGADGSLLTRNEYDGYVVLTGTAHTLQLPWHVIPRKAADVAASPGGLLVRDGSAHTRLENRGAGTAQIDAYSLLGVSRNLAEGRRGEQSPTPDLRAVGVQTFPTPAGFCGPSEGYLLSLAANTWERTAHANAPAAIQWLLDTDRRADDPKCAADRADPFCPDYAVYSFDQSFTALSDGRNLAWVEDLATGRASAFFYSEHAANTGNVILTICDTQIGSPAPGQLVGATVQALDVYFGGPGDEIGGLTFAPLGERFLPYDPATGQTFPPLDLPAGASEMLHVADLGAAGTNPSEFGLLLVTTGDRGAGARGGAAWRSEAVVLPASSALDRLDLSRL